MSRKTWGHADVTLIPICSALACARKNACRHGGSKTPRERLGSPPPRSDGHGALRLIKVSCCSRVEVSGFGCGRRREGPVENSSLETPGPTPSRRRPLGGRSSLREDPLHVLELPRIHLFMSGSFGRSPWLSCLSRFALCLTSLNMPRAPVPGASPCMAWTSLTSCPRRKRYCAAWTAPGLSCGIQQTRSRFSDAAPFWRPTHKKADGFARCPSRTKSVPGRGDSHSAACWT